MSQKKYVSLSKLNVFLDNLRNKFAAKTHEHTVSEIKDYKVDTELSSTSTNPVENKRLNEEFEAIGDAIGALELVLDEHDHSDSYYTKVELDTTLAQKSQVQMITWEDDD